MIFSIVWVRVSEAKVEAIIENKRNRYRKAASEHVLKVEAIIETSNRGIA